MPHQTDQRHFQDEASGISIQNCLRATVEQLVDDQHPALTLTRLNVGESPIIARLTDKE